MPKYEIENDNCKLSARLTGSISTALQNLYLDILRKNKSENLVRYVNEFDVEPSYFDSFGELDLFFYDNYPLVKALMCLTEKQRFVITKHYLEGYSLSEIAKFLIITPQSVSVIHQRALERLRLYKDEILAFREERDNGR